MVTEAQKRATQRFEEKAYFKALVRFPKEQESLIRKAAEDAGESLNSFIVKAVLEKTK